MIIIQPSFEIINFTPDLEKTIEICGRVCYKSEDKITPESSSKCIERWKDSFHHSVLEHAAITVRIICDRGVSHELVRHRIASFSMESTRYCNYSKNKFGGEIAVIDPSGAFPEMTEADYNDWYASCVRSEMAYFSLLGSGRAPQMARSVLPNSLKTELMITTNPREWMHIFNLRCAPSAHPQVRQVMIPIAKWFAEEWPALFNTEMLQQGDL